MVADCEWRVLRSLMQQDLLHAQGRTWPMRLLFLGTPTGLTPPPHAVTVGLDELRAYVLKQRKIWVVACQPDLPRNHRDHMRLMQVIPFGAESRLTPALPEEIYADLDAYSRRRQRLVNARIEDVVGTMIHHVGRDRELSRLNVTPAGQRFAIDPGLCS